MTLPALTATQQMIRFRQRWPNFEIKEVRGVLVARGELQPSSLTRAYSVRLEYRIPSVPEVYIESPRLVRRGSEPDKEIPHTYDSGKIGEERPCVFQPGTDWRPTMHISDSIMPWLMSWLVDYELWLALGKWTGGGVH